MAQGRKSTGPGGLSAESIMVFIGIGLLTLIVGGIWVALKVAAGIDDTRAVPGPIPAFADLISGRIRWSAAATGVFILELVVLGLLMVTGVWTAIMAQLQGVFASVPAPL